MFSLLTFVGYHGINCPANSTNHVVFSCAKLVPELITYRDYLRKQGCYFSKSPYDY